MFSNNLTQINESIEAVNASLYDPVTGLLSMRGFLEVARQEKPAVRDSGDYLKYAVVYFNLSNFKIYNSKYGLDAGDERLRDIAYILKTTFPDELLARFADDHFVVFTEQEGLEKKVDLVNVKILQLGSETFLSYRIITIRMWVRITICAIHWYPGGERTTASPCHLV